LTIHLDISLNVLFLIEALLIDTIILLSKGIVNSFLCGVQDIIWS